MGTSRYVSICIRFLVVLHHSIKLIRLGGENDDGFMLYLMKMNLELFKTKQAQATDSWWDRLFMAHGDIRFDDYDKDLTDLPTPIAEVRTANTSLLARARFSFFIN